MENVKGICGNQESQTQAWHHFPHHPRIHLLSFEEAEKEVRESHAH